MAALTRSNRDLASDDNLIQARYELHKAIDRGGEAEQAAWSREWGETALDRVDTANQEGGGWDFFGPSKRLVDVAEKAGDAADALVALLHAATPDIALAKTRASEIAKQLTTINNMLEPDEG